MKALVVALLCSGSVKAESVFTNIKNTVTGGYKKVKSSLLSTFKKGTKSIQAQIDTLNGKDSNVENLKRQFKQVNKDLTEGTKAAVSLAGKTLQSMSEKFEDMIEDAKHISEAAKLKKIRVEAKDLADQMRAKYLKTEG